MSLAGLPLACIIRIASRLNSALNLWRFSIEHLHARIVLAFRCPRNRDYFTVILNIRAKKTLTLFVMALIAT